MSDFKVVHVVESFATGTREVVRLLSNSQAAEGWNVTVWYGVVEGSRATPCEGFDSRVQFLPVPFLGQRNILGLFRSLLWFIKNRASDCDVIHLHSSFAGMLCRLAFWRFKKKMVYTPHGISLIRSDLGYAKKLALLFSENVLTVVSGATVVACSQGEAAIIRKTIPSAKLSIIPNGAEISVAPPAPIGEFHHPVRLVSVGRVSKQKNFQDLLVLAKEWVGPLDLVVVGGGDADEIARLRQAGIVVTGWVAKDEVQKYLEKSDLFLQTSLWEGMPVSVLEAFACGLPVVARACVGTTDLVFHRKTGYLYFDSKDLCSVIQMALTNAEETQSMAHQASRLLRDEFSAKRMHVKYRELYLSVGR